MKRLAPIVLCSLLALPVLAAPNAQVGAALDEATASARVAAAELAAAKAERDALKSTVGAAGEVSRAKDQVIKDRDERITQITAERDLAQSWGYKFKIGALVVIGVLFFLGFVLCLSNRQFTDSLVCGLITLIAFGGSSAVARYDAQIGMASLWGGGVLAACGIAYLCYSVWSNRNAAEEHANILPLIKKAGILTKGQIDKIDAIAWQETGRVADRIRASVTGKPVKDLAKAADIEVPPAPQVAVTVPTVQPVAVTSGVVTSFAEAGTAGAP